CESQATCDSFAFGTVAAAPSSTPVGWTGSGKRQPLKPSPGLHNQRQAETLPLTLEAYALMSQHHSIKALLWRDAGGLTHSEDTDAIQAMRCEPEHHSIKA